MRQIDDAADLPEAVRRDAFQAAIVALGKSLARAGYALDAFAQLEVLDLELDRIEGRLDSDSPKAH